MKHLFRNPTPGVAEYVTLALFLGVYAAAIIFVAAPQAVISLVTGN